MKRIISMLLCLMLVLAMATTAFAATGTVDLSISGAKPGHTFYAYQIFSGEVNNGVLTEFQWGSGFGTAEAGKDGDSFLTALKADTTPIANSLQTNSGTTMAAELATVDGLAELVKEMEDWGNNLNRIDYFAKAVKPYMVGQHYEAVSTADGCTFTGLQPGYYLIVDVTNPGTGADNQGNDLEDDFYTKFIIAMTGSTTVTVKGDVPTVDKRVSETLNDGYGESITNQLNRVHYYEWVGTIPDYIDYYDFYYYEFEDTMSAGLDFNRIEEIYIMTGNQKIAVYDASKTPAVVNQSLMPDTYPMAAITGNNEKTIRVVWNDLKAKYAALESSDKIVVKYSAMLNQNAVVGQDGTENSVTLRYSNSPNDNSKHGITPPSDARVYTFGMELTKVDGDNHNTKLSGAEFYLYHNHTEYEQGTGTPVKVPHYAVITEVPVTVTTTGADGQPATETIKEKRITGWVTDKEVATVLVTDENGLIEVYGLKDNIDYYLSEKKAPTNYNKLLSDVKLHISSYSVNTTDDTVSSITYLVDSNSHTVTGDTAKAGIVTLLVENKMGSTLPSTGGMGTTVMYIAGGILVLAAVVLLVTKKRMTSAE